MSHDESASKILRLGTRSRSDAGLILSRNHAILSDISEIFTRNTKGQEMIAHEQELEPFANDSALIEGVNVDSSIRRIDLFSLSPGFFWQTLTWSMNKSIKDPAYLFLGAWDLDNEGLGVFKEILKRCTGIEEIQLKVEVGGEINENVLEALVVGIQGHSSLRKLDLARGNIGAVGCKALAGLLQDANCNLVDLNLFANPINDDCAVILANALKSNCKLKKLCLDKEPGPQPPDQAITRIGWNAFANVLCDKSSVNRTYSSNHTVQNLGNELPPIRRLNYSLLLNNSHGNAKQIAMKKILHNHRHIDMGPLFEWGLKALPSVVAWFDMARDGAADNRLKGIIEARKLGAIYQFIKQCPRLARQVLRMPVTTDNVTQQ